MGNDKMRKEMMCKRCLLAMHTLRRVGFRDSLAWGAYADAPTQLMHATNSNSPKLELEFTDAITGQKHRRTGKDSLCVQFSSELAWLTATKPARTTIYLAHPVSGADFADNVNNATKWLRYLRRLPLSTLCELVDYQYETRPLICCPWLAAIEEDELYPGGREAIIQDSRDTAMMFDEVWMLYRITEGMMAEANAARTVRDLTHLGKIPGSHIKKQLVRLPTKRK